MKRETVLTRVKSWGFYYYRMEKSGPKPGSRVDTCVEEKPPKAFLCWESHLTTGRAEATSPRRV